MKIKEKKIGEFEKKEERDFEKLKTNSKPKNPTCCLIVYRIIILQLKIIILELKAYLLLLPLFLSIFHDSL